MSAFSDGGFKFPKVPTMSPCFGGALMIPTRWGSSTALIIELRIICARWIHLRDESNRSQMVPTPGGEGGPSSRRILREDVSPAPCGVAPRRARVLTGSSNSPPAGSPRARACRDVSLQNSCSDHFAAASLRLVGDHPPPPG